MFVQEANMGFISSIGPWLDLALLLDHKRKWEQLRGVLPNTGNLSF